MKSLIFILLICSTQLISQVTLSNNPDMNVSWNPATQKYDILGSPSNINIPGLINHIMMGNVTIDDGIYAFMPLQCVGTNGPIIVEESIIYTSDFDFNLISTSGIYIYQFIENFGQGSFNFSASECPPLMFAGDIVVGTGIHNLHILPHTAFSQAPIPISSQAVHIGTVGGSISFTASNTVCVVADKFVGNSAQIGIEHMPGNGSINIFAANGVLVHAENMQDTYARIGYGNPFLPDPIIGDILVGVEVGNIYVIGSDLVSSRAAIGHIAQRSISGNIETYALDPVVGGTDGNVKITAGHTGEARIGHYTDSPLFINGNITLTADGNIDIISGVDPQARAKIGHYKTMAGDILSGYISVESIKTLTINSGSGFGNAGIGHRAPEVNSPADISVSGDSISIHADGNSSSRIGHFRELPGIAFMNGNILLLANQLHMHSGTLQDGYTQIGHMDENISGFSSGNTDIYVSGDITVLSGSADNTKALISHSDQTIFDNTLIVSGNDILLNSGTNPLNSEIHIASNGLTDIKAYRDILATSDIGNITLESQNNKLIMDAGRYILMDITSTPDICIANAMRSVNLRASENIGLSQYTLDTDDNIHIEADAEFISGHFWGVIPMFGNNLGLFNNTIFASNSLPIFSDQFGMYQALDAQTTLINTSSTNLYFSQYDAQTGLESTLNLGVSGNFDLSGVMNYIEIGDKPEATTQIESYSQSCSNIFMENSLINVDSLFVKCNDTLEINNSMINTNDRMVLVCDNAAPNINYGNLGVFTTSSSILESLNDGMEIYSLSPQANKLAGGHIGSLFNGNPYPNCTLPCSDGVWLSYYPDMPHANPGNTLFHFKTDTTILAILGDIDITCDNEYVYFDVQLDENLKEEVILEAYDVGKMWVGIGSIHPDQPKIDMQKTRGYDFFRLKTKYEPPSKVFRINCTTDRSDCTIPNIVDKSIFIPCHDEYNTLRIINSQGIIVFKGQPRSQIDVSSLAPGIYYVLRDIYLDKVVIH